MKTTCPSHFLYGFMGIIVGAFLPLFCFVAAMVGQNIGNQFFSDARSGMVDFVVVIIAVILFLFIAFVLVRYQNNKKCFIIGCILGFCFFLSMGWHKPYEAKKFYDQLHVGMMVDELQLLLNGTDLSWRCSLNAEGKRAFIANEHCYEIMLSLPREEENIIVDVNVLARGPGLSKIYFAIIIDHKGKVIAVSPITNSH